jgi:aconitate hydratase
LLGFTRQTLKSKVCWVLRSANEGDYDRFQEDDTIDIIDLTSFAPEKQLTLVLRHTNGTTDTIKVNHTYNAGQIEWFKAGSALNLMAKEIVSTAPKAPAKKSLGKKIKAVAKKIKKAFTKKAAKKKVVKKAAKKTVKKAAKKVVKAKKAVKKVVKKAKKTAKKKK